MFLFGKSDKKLLCDSDKAVILLDNFLSSLPTITSVSVALDDLNKFNVFLKKYNYNLNKDVIIDLLSQSESFTLLVDYLANKTYYVDSYNYNKNNYLIKLILNVWNDEKINYLYTDCNDQNNELPSRTYFREITKMPLLTPEEEKVLFEEYWHGNLLAFNKIVEGNLRLVISVAKRLNRCDISFDDLIQEGNLGLIEAIKHYQDNRNCKFSTYAYTCIRRYILRAIMNKSKMIRLPEYLYDKISLYNQAKNELDNELGREATIEEIAKYMNISVNNAHILYYAQFEPTSINERIKDEDGEEKEHFLASEEFGPEDIMVKKDLKDSVRKLIADCNLTEKEMSILNERYGLVDGNIKTFREIGKQYGVSKDRIRQIEMKVLEKLRLMKNINEYKIYVCDDNEACKQR